MAELLVDVPGCALAMYAHPDDPDVSCGGTLAAWAKSGSEVHVLLCTDGGKGTSDPDEDPAELVRRRAAEAAEAAAVIGLAGQECLGYPDGELVDDPSFREALVAAVRRIRPDTVLCPDPTAVFFGQEYFNHRDHRITGWAVLDAIAPRPPFRSTSRRPGRRTRSPRSSSRAPSSPMCGWTSRTRSTSRARPSAVTGASSPTAWSGRRPRCGWPPRMPAVRRAFPWPRASGDCASVGDAGHPAGAVGVAGRWRSTGSSSTWTWTPSSPRSRCSTIRRWPGSR